ncbi:ribonuclease HI family protein [Pullulanibacillus sp. KACC 23026]|uniref:ribonuclease HI family protein n=1 Tax=Pullulanibacillus sp. KACC 23026 TaxID=3028315 RepID=UPI0023B04B4E|nr:ribonuclease HI family protein [Pullulanibacillus sp. KACC 23026]WEG10869.1 ribonuclease HI family protein [Pullulanibacillus sp. KACC 23026]
MVDIYIDGASAGDPGPSGIGIMIKDPDGPPLEYSLPIGIKSNHEAEFEALIQALKIAQQKGYRLLSVKTDSQLVDRSFNKRYVKNKDYLPLLDQILTLETHFDHVFVKWIPSSQNKKTDQLARIAIQQQKKQK